MVGLRLVIASFFVLFSASFAFAQSDPEENKRANLGLGFELKMGGNISPGRNLILTDIPLELRQVPSHPKDTWIYGSRQVTRTIPYDSMNLGVSTEGLKLSLLPETTIWRFRLRSGPTFYVGARGPRPSKSNEGNTREVNQYGKPVRGYGTSLVYYSISGRGSWKPGWSGETDLDIGNNFLLIAGYDRNNHYTLTAESGYDRFDALEKYKDYELGDIRLDRNYFGFGFQPEIESEGSRPITLYVVGGKVRPRFDPNELGKGMSLDYGKRWFFEFGVSVHFLHKFM